MKLIRTLALCALATAFFVGGTSCITTQKKAKQPPHRKMSSMPHNTPASWEGQGGLPGLGGGGR